MQPDRALHLCQAVTKMSSLNIHDTFPDEIYLKVFSSLGVCSVLRLSLTCKRWKRLLEDQTIWEILSRRDWPVATQELSSPPCSWKNWYKSHYFEAYVGAFQLARPIKQNVSHINSKQLLLRGLSFQQERIIAIKKNEVMKRTAAFFIHPSGEICIGSSQETEIRGLQQVANNVVLVQGKETVIGFRLYASPEKSPFIFRGKKNLAFATHDCWVALIFKSKIKLYNLSECDLNEYGKKITTFHFDKESKRNRKRAYLYLTDMRIIAIFNEEKIHLFDIAQKRKIATLTKKMEHWTIHRNSFYYLFNEKVGEIDIVKGTIKREFQLPFPAVQDFRFFRPGRMVCARDYLALIAPNHRPTAGPRLLLHAFRLTDFSLVHSWSIHSSAGNMKAYGNILMVGTESYYLDNNQAQGQLWVIDLASQNILRKFSSSSIGALPYFYDGKIISVSSHFIDIWHLNRPSSHQGKTTKLRLQEEGFVTAQ